MKKEQQSIKSNSICSTAHAIWHSSPKWISVSTKK